MNNFELERVNKSNEIHAEEIIHLKESLKLAEEHAIQKDREISHLISRLREYEMGEYGLAQAMAEIKMCKNIIKAREREIENLTEELNFVKFQLAGLMEKSKIHSGEEDKTISFSQKKLEMVKQEFNDNAAATDIIQAKQSSIYKPPKDNQNDIYNISLQNEKLRKELQDICEKAMKITMKNFFDDQTKWQENLKISQTSIEKFRTKETSLSSSPIYSFNSESFFKLALNLVDKDDNGVQEIFHELLNQIKILKENQAALIRRYLTLYDYNSNLRTEVFKLKKELTEMKTAKDETNILLDNFENINRRYKKYEFIFKNFDFHIKDKCKNQKCVAKQNSFNQLKELTQRLLQDIFFLKCLLEVAHNQTQAFETLCLSQESEINLLQQQIFFIQVQSDENILLGKLYSKLLKLQFRQVACLDELKKYKLTLTEQLI